MRGALSNHTKRFRHRDRHIWSISLIRPTYLHLEEAATCIKSKFTEQEDIWNKKENNSCTKRFIKICLRYKQCYSSTVSLILYLKEIFSPDREWSRVCNLPQPSWSLKQTQDWTWRCFLPSWTRDQHQQSRGGDGVYSIQALRWSIFSNSQSQNRGQ